MPSLDLRPFVDRTTALLDSAPPTSRRETRRWLVEPFVEMLGWDVRADSCVTDRVVDGTRFEYVPAIDSVPALYVALEAYDESLDETRANDIRETMAWTGVDRAIYTNGREYLLLAGTTDVEYYAFTLPELVDNESALGMFSREAVHRRLEHHSREHVARQLAVERPRLVDSIVDRLTDATVQNEVYADEFESATDRFLDQLVVVFADDGPEPTDSTADVSIRFSESSITDDTSSTEAESTERSNTDADESGDGGATDRTSVEWETNAESNTVEWETNTESNTAGWETNADASGDGDTGSEADGGPVTEDHQSDFDTRTENSSGTAAGTDSEDKSEGDDDGGSADAETGEYVVRFFNERGSIGAIGHSTPTGALVGAAEYLFERGLSGIQVPWSPDDADGTVLNDDPVHADGSPMAEPHQLSNGLYLATAGDVDAHAARVEAMAARAGLRAMLTGDWK